MAVADDEAAVRLGGPEGWVTLWNRVHPYDDDMLGFCIEIGAEEMSATLHRVVLHNETPATFVAEVAESFEGWSGEKAWESLNRDVTIKAVFRTWGYVDLTWGLAPWRESMPWRAEVTVRGIQAGEDMKTLAAGLKALLGADEGEVRGIPDVG